jgi:hypothetical protein
LKENPMAAEGDHNPILTLLSSNFTVAKLNPNSPEHSQYAASLVGQSLGETVSQASKPQPFFFAHTETEISLVGSSSLLASLPTEGTTRDDGWRCFAVKGPMAFTIVGVMAKLSSCLAEAGVSLLAQSTFDTDYVLVKEAQSAEAVTAFRSSGVIVNVEADDCS